MNVALRTPVVFACLVLALGCDAMKAKEPKQAQDPTIQAPKYGDTKVDTLAAPDDAGK